METEWISQGRRNPGGLLFNYSQQTSVRNPWKYTLVGVVVGFVAGGALFLFSGDVIVILFVRAVEKVVDIVVGLVGLNGH
jgi:hypothetical protein